MKRVAAISLAALLSVGGATTVLASAAGAAGTDPSSTDVTTEPTTSSTELPIVEVTDFSITLAGLGDLSLSVDPTTHEISNITVTPLDGITVADPIAVHNGIQLDFTLADGTVRSIVVEIEGHHGQIRIEVEDQESEDEDEGHHGDGPPAIEDRGQSAEHRNDAHDRHGPDVTSVPAVTSGGASSSSGSSRSGSRSDSSERQESESRSGRSGDSDSRD